MKPLPTLLLVAILALVPAAFAQDAETPHWLEANLTRVLEGGPGSTLILQHPEDPRRFIQFTHAQADPSGTAALLFDRPRDGLSDQEADQIAAILERLGHPTLSRHRTGPGQPDYEGFHFLVDGGAKAAAQLADQLLHGALGLPAGQRPELTEF